MGREAVERCQNETCYGIENDAESICCTLECLFGGMTLNKTVKLEKVLKFFFESKTKKVLSNDWIKVLERSSKTAAAFCKYLFLNMFSI